MNKEKEIQKINSCINDLVYEKSQIKKAYNYYHCFRDREQFKAIEKNYGVGTPTSVEFTPLIKKHIDVLVGEYLELDPDLQISCKDDATISNILRDKQLAAHKECFDYFSKYLENSIVNILMGSQEPTNDPFIDKEIQKIKESVEKDYVSQYEIAAQNILNYAKNSRDIDMKNKMRELFTDLLVSGTAYYQVKPSPGGKGIQLRINNPVDSFIERNVNSFYLNKSPRCVVRRYLTVDQIMAEYGDDLTDEARSILKEYKGGTKEGNSYIVRTISSTDAGNATQLMQHPGILGGMEVVPTMANNDMEYPYVNRSLIEVYECEWIEVDKTNTMQRHEGVKIGGKIYICKGVNDNVPRSVSNPRECSLSLNGMFFNDKNGVPQSLILNTMSLQDRYDLIIYYRDNLIANSGTVGDWIDLASLPSVLGVDLTDVLMKWQAYKKQGIAIYDSSQEGANLINTSFNGFNDVLKAEAMQAFQIALDSIEQQASSITGVFQEKLGGIQQRDAVSNVKVGVRQSTLLTKQYFSAMDLMYKEVNYDILNTAKIAYKDGISGVLVLGNRLSKVFKALPEHYTMTDFDIHIQDSTEIMQVKETMTQAGIELIKSGQADAAMMVNMALAKNVRELKDYIEKSVADKKAENDQIGQLQQQLQQYDQQAKEMQKQMQQLQQQNEQLQRENKKNSDEKIAIEQQRVKIEEQKANDTREYNNKMIEMKERQVEAEILQLQDGNPYNDEIRNI